MFGFKLSRNPSRRKVFKDRRDRITSVGTLFFVSIRIYFIRISRLKFAKF